MVSTDIKPVVWLKRRQRKPGQLFRSGVKASSVRTVTLSTYESLLVAANIMAEEAKNAQLKKLAAARKAR